MNIVVLYSTSIWFVVLAFTEGHKQPLLETFDLLSETVHSEQFIASAILDILETSLVHEKQTSMFNFYTMTLPSTGDHRSRFFGGILDRVMSSVGGQIGVRIGVQRPISGGNDRHYSVLLVDSAVALHLLYEELRVSHLNVVGYYIILLHTFQKHYSDDLHEVVHLNFLNGVINANVLVYALPNLVLLFTGYPYSPYHCNGAESVIKNKYADSSWHHDKFFPDKLANLYGCPLVCATWEELPYFEVRNNDRFIGIEGKLLEYLKDYLNFTVQYRWMNEKEIERTLEESGSIFDELFRNGTDFAVGAFHFKPTTKDDFYEPTTSYYHSTIKFIVNSNMESYSPFTKLLLPFFIQIWYLILLLFLVGIAISLTMECRQKMQKNFVLGANNNTPIYNMFVATLGGSVSPLPRRNFARFLLVQWVLASMILRSAYQGILYHFIRMDVTPSPPSTLDEVIQQNYRILMTNITFAAVQHFQKLKTLGELLDGTEYEHFDMVRESKVKIGILTPYEYFGYFKRTHVRRHADFHVVQQPLFTQQLSIYMRKNSIMLSHFNELILLYNSIGLMDKVESEFVDDSWKVRSTGVDETPKSMHISQLYGAIEILIIGNSVAGLVLLFEMFCHSIMRRFLKLRAHWTRKRQEHRLN